MAEIQPKKMHHGGEVGGEERQRDLNPAARHPEGTGSKAQTEWSVAFRGFLFLCCLGLGFVLELVLGDEGHRSEALGPSWRLSWGGISQEKSPEGLTALSRSPQLQIRSGGCSRELGSNGKTSMAWFSLLQPSSWEQGMLISGGACAAFSRPHAAAVTFQATPLSSSCPCFLLHKKTNPKGCCWHFGAAADLSPGAGRGLFSLHQHGIREQGGLWGSAWLPSILSCLVFFINTIANCLYVHHHLMFLV